MFDETIKFKYAWRDYQAKVLDKAQQFVDDGHIHVVAAPGSGKTVLGLELMRRIDLPTIILAPTIAIRNQWAERFTQLFMGSDTANELPEWISLDVNKPKKLTIITYQGLYSALDGRLFKQEQEIKVEQAEEEPGDDTILVAPEEEPHSSENLEVPLIDFSSPSRSGPQKIVPDGAAKAVHQKNQKAAVYLKKLNELGIRTIIVDEAHHLRNDWWRSLNDLKSGLINPVVIALTATPPYDAESNEWRKYQSFCGPIDIEVSVPELVARKDLCPHQDFVYFSELTSIEEQSVEQVKQRIKVYIDDIKKDEEFIQAVLQHEVLANPQTRESIVFQNPAYFTAIGSFLLAIDHKQEGRPLLNMISGRNYGIMPKFDEKQAEILLQNALYRDAYFASDTHEALVKRLREAGSRAGVIEARQVSLTNNKNISLILKNSVSKLESVRRIVAFEQAAFGPKLRCVILTDFIRQEYLPPNTKKLNKLGVVPIFETIRHSIGKTGTNKIGVLSGVIVVIPNNAKQSFMKHMNGIAGELGSSAPKISFKPYSTDSAYVVCTVNDQTRQFIVRAVTQTFEDGEIEILVGTKSLLGEGWDAPTINSLVLASTVGSFMLSNQMRGRAIRTDKNDPNKVANIWHIATVLPDASTIFGTAKIDTHDLGPDFSMLSRRFDSFVGINSRQDIIESGVYRALYLHAGPFSLASLPQTLERANYETFEAARNKDAISKKWQRVLASDKAGQLVHTMQADAPKLPRAFVYLQTLKSAMIALLTNWAMWFLLASRFNSIYPTSYTHYGFFISGVLFALFSIYTLLRFVWYLIISIRHISPERSIEQVGEALLHSLCSSKLIKTPVGQLQVVSNKSSGGLIACGLKGGTTYENDLFLDCLEELLSPIDNPRYILQSNAKRRFLTIGYNAYSVPEPLARQKKTVLILLSQWKQRVGPCHGIYTRTIAGRRSLLKARRESLSGKLSPSYTRHSIWS